MSAESDFRPPSNGRRAVEDLTLRVREKIFAVLMGHPPGSKWRL